MTIDLVEKKIYIYTDKKVIDPILNFTRQKISVKTSIDNFDSFSYT
jgi:hypothetical protein